MKKVNVAELSMKTTDSCSSQSPNAKAILQPFFPREKKTFTYYSRHCEETASTCQVEDVMLPP